MKRPKYVEIWKKFHNNEIGWLAQGMKGRVDGTNTVHCIHKNEVPHDRVKDVMYGKINYNYREDKAEPNRARLMARGDRSKYYDNVRTPTADLFTIELLINSIVSTPGAENFTMNIKKFYLNTPMAQKEYL